MKEISTERPLRSLSKEELIRIIERQRVELVALRLAGRKPKIREG